MDEVHVRPGWAARAALSQTLKVFLQVERVPATDYEALKSNLMGLFEKRRARSFFMCLPPQTTKEKMKADRLARPRMRNSLQDLQAAVSGHLASRSALEVCNASICLGALMACYAAMYRKHSANS